MQTATKTTTYNLRFRWGTGKGRDNYGYTTCYLHVDGRRVSGCDGGGYDLKGTAFGHWIARAFRERLHQRITTEHYGLVFVDPTFDPSKAEVPGTGETVEAREKRQADITSFGLERLQAAYAATSKVPTERHTIASMDGGCGFACMQRVLEAIGGQLEFIRRNSGEDLYQVHMSED